MAAPSKPTKHEFLLKDPADPHRVIAYGWDGPGSYYAALFVSGEKTMARESVNADRRQARRDIVEWAIELGFFALSDIDEATTALDTLRLDQLPHRLRTLVDVVRSFAD